MADLVAADQDRPAARDQHPVAREQHLVLVLEPAREELQKPALGQHLTDTASHAVAGQREQAPRLFVRERDGAVAVGRDRAFVDALKACLPLLEEPRDLVRLEPKGLALQAPGQEPRGDHADRKRRQQRGRKTGQLAEPPLAERRFQESDGDHADHLALEEDRRFAPGRYAERAALHAHPRLAGEDDGRRLVDRLADERRVGVGVADAA